MGVQTKTDSNIRKILVQASEDAEKKVSALEKNSTFSAGVRTAQIRLVMKEIKDILNGTFQEIQSTIAEGQRQAASAAIDGLTETDKKYLESALLETGAVLDFIASQKLQAKIQVINSINSVTKNPHSLSQRVYRTRALAQNWVQRDVANGIARGDSAKQIAAVVRKHIRPNTPGGVSYAALRLGRTEVNNAFHATSIEFSKDRPWIKGMQWHLSAVHEVDPNQTEICERYANQIFDVDNVPGKPHPQCRCFVAPVMEPVDVFIRNLTAGQYRDWIANAA